MPLNSISMPSSTSRTMYPGSSGTHVPACFVPGRPRLAMRLPSNTMNMSVPVVSMVTDGDLVMGEDLPRRNARSQVSAALQADALRRGAGDGGQAQQAPRARGRDPVRGGVRVEAEPEVAAEQVRGHHRALRRDGGEAVG